MDKFFHSVYLVEKKTAQAVITASSGARPRRFGQDGEKHG